MLVALLFVHPIDEEDGEGDARNTKQRQANEQQENESDEGQTEEYITAWHHD